MPKPWWKRLEREKADREQRTNRWFDDRARRGIILTVGSREEARDLQSKIDSTDPELREAGLSMAWRRIRGIIASRKQASST